MVTALCIKFLHKLMTQKHVGMFYPTQHMQTIEHICSSMFRFRRKHFYQVLTAMKLDGSKSMLCGRKGPGTRNRAQCFPADCCLMTVLVLQRMACPCRFVDFVIVCGLSTYCSTEFVTSITPLPSITPLQVFYT